MIFYLKYKWIALLVVLSGHSMIFGQSKILIVGDSWAETIWRSNIFDSVLLEEGFAGVSAIGGIGDKNMGTLTAIGGSRADQWAGNHLDWLFRIDELIQENPEISFIHLIIGGNDILRLVSEFNIMEISPFIREYHWNIIKRDISKIVEHCLSIKPDLKILIFDYDYLNIKNAEKIYGFDFGGMDQKQLNEAFIEVGIKKKEITEEYDRCFYLENWGILEKMYHPETSGSSWHLKYPSADISGEMPVQADIGDGIHPNIDAHKKMLRRAVDSFYSKYLNDD